MLSCQNLCGRHNRRLISLADRVQHGEKGHHRLPGSHISLNQPLRDKRSPQILPQAVQALPLSRCQFIGQSRRCPLHQIVLCHRRKSPVVFYRALILLLELRTEKEIEKFFVHKTVSGLQQAVEGLRKMNLPIGLLFSRKLFPLHHKAGEQVSRKFHRIQRLTDRFFDHLIGQPLCQTVDRLQRLSESRILPLVVDGALFHLLSALLRQQLSVKNVGNLRLQLTSEVRHPIPDQFHRLRLLAVSGGHGNLHSFSTAHQRNLAQDTADGTRALPLSRCLSRSQRFGKLLIGARKMKEYITCGVYSYLCKQLFCFLSDAFDLLYRSFQSHPSLPLFTPPTQHNSIPAVRPPEVPPPDPGISPPRRRQAPEPPTRRHRPRRRR